MSAIWPVSWPKLWLPLLILAACLPACDTSSDANEPAPWENVKAASKPTEAPSVDGQTVPDQDGTPAERIVESPLPAPAVGCEFDDEQQTLDRMRLQQYRAADMTEAGDLSATDIWIAGGYKQYPPLLAMQLSESSTVMSQSEERIGLYGIGFSRYAWPPHSHGGPSRCACVSACPGDCPSRRARRGSPW